jgi:hypothetical protein
MNGRDKLRETIVHGCSVTLAVAAFAAVAAWAYTQLDPSEQLLLATSGLANGTPFIKQTNTGADHERP